MLLLRYSGFKRPSKGVFFFYLSAKIAWYNFVHEYPLDKS